MCIIAYKPLDKTVDIKTLANCFENNSDGCGFMTVQGKQVVGRKGYMKFEEMVQSLAELDFLDEKQENVIRPAGMVFHFRIGTHGGVGPGVTHPFPIHKEVDVLKQLMWTAPTGIAHNGIISGVDFDNTKEISDTMAFIRDFISKPLLASNLHDEDLLNFMSHSLKGNKFAIMHATGDVFLLGDWVESTDGISFSNHGYTKRVKTYVTTYRGGSYYGGAPTDLNVSGQTRTYSPRTSRAFVHDWDENELFPNEAMSSRRDTVISLPERLPTDGAIESVLTEEERLALAEDGLTPDELQTWKDIHHTTELNSDDGPEAPSKLTLDAITAYYKNHKIYAHCQLGRTSEGCLECIYYKITHKDDLPDAACTWHDYREGWGNQAHGHGGV